VKLATFSARIGTCGQIAQQRVIELASTKDAGICFGSTQVIRARRPAED